MKIARQGWPFILGGLCAAGVGALPVMGELRFFFVPLGLLFAVFCCFFFRDPDRPAPVDMTKIYSPGDGRVLSVSREGPGDITTIRVFLSILDVHVQRLPCSGRVDRVQYQPGAFFAAMKEEARLNERNIVRIIPGGAREPVIVEQIAGYVARRIECWVREGDEARAGRRYGIIYFGSQVALHLSGRVAPLVRPGDRVVGGVTEVAEWTV